VFQFSITVSKSTRAGRAEESTPKVFVDDFLVGTDSVFVDLF